MSILRESFSPPTHVRGHPERRLNVLLSVRENMLASDDDKLPDDELIAEVS